MSSQLLPLKIPPGVYRNGTEYQSGGGAKALYGGLGVSGTRYYDADLVRWHEGQMRPIGGWVSFSPNAVTGKGRALKPWADNSSTAWVAIGTETGLYVLDRTGGLFDITPDGFLPGRPDAIVGGGYGAGVYGVGTYGTIRTQDSAIQDATVWTLDVFGQYLVGVSPDDRTVYTWELVTGTRAQPVENAPDASSLVVTNEGFLMLLGAGGNPRLVQWSDQRDDTVWTPSLTNQAGQFPLKTNGRLMCGRVINAGILIFTDVDVFLCTYLANTLVYGFEPAGTECGIISRQAVVVLTTLAYWMGRNAFYCYNGFVTAVPCDVADAVFSNINQLQISKIYAVHNAAFGEITWYYPSLNSDEIDSYVTFSHIEGHWEIGSLIRTAGADAGVYPVPLMVDPSGVVWEHETGFDYGGAIPFARSGPIELGNGDNVLAADGFLPDIDTLDAVTATFFVRFYPQDTQYSFGPYLLMPQTDVRFEGRQLEVLYTGVPGVDWRIGVPRLSVTQGGGR